MSNFSADTLWHHANFLNRMIAFLCAVGMSFSASAQESSASPIEHLLVSRCLECHGSLQEGGLDLRTREGALIGGETGPAIVPGTPKKSFLIEQVFNEKMPPKLTLSDEEVELLEDWIAQGAAYPEKPLDLFAYTTNSRAGYDWWSLRPIKKTAPPTIADAPSGWSEHPIDQFVLAGLSEKGLKPSPQASPATLIRRATYDLIGLPPTADETRAFIAACANETGAEDTVGDRAYADLIDQLLSSPHYGERWARHWLDVVRFGESTGFEVNHIVDDMWPYRDYVIRSLNDDKPYNEFIMEHLAGDSIGPGDVDVEVGMTFLVAGAHDIVGNQDAVQAAQIRANSIDEMIRATSESFLGLTVGCARCHDHKFDPISQKDYYRFYATFGGVYHDSRDVATKEQKRERRHQVGPLERERDGLNKEKFAIEKIILDRAASKVEEYDAIWSRPPVDRKGTEEHFETVRARYLRITAEGRDNDPDARTGYRLDEVEVWTDEPESRNVAASRNGGTAKGNSTTPGDFAEAYDAALTIDEAFGASWIATAPSLTLQFAQPESIHRALFSSDRPGALSATANESTFIGEYVIEVSLDGETWTRVADSHDRQPNNDRHRRKRYLDAETTQDERESMAALDKKLREVGKKISAIPKFPRLRVGRLTQPKDSFHVFLGGDPQQKGEQVVPASMDTLSRAVDHYALAEDAPEQERRLALANWIANKRNPLTPRVLVNRLWHYHFGTGLVSTPSDFGFMGGRPSHPALIDWLASEFSDPNDANQAWRIKGMHRLIMTSAPYRQAGTHNAKSAEIDANSRMLWRYPPRRLSAEEIRDTMLAKSGLLNTEMGGPGFRLYRYLRDNVSTYVPLETFGPETYRRSIYHQNVRASRVDLMSEFDSPDCALSEPRRVTTTSPLQALTLMNHQFTLDV
ncbi:MAG: DUF1549 domain-containing protein, partial [Candidatus Hydrogenedentota bacterium]